MKLLPTWLEFLAAYEANPANVCMACCRAARTYASYGKGLRDVNAKLGRRAPYLPKAKHPPS